MAAAFTQRELKWKAVMINKMNETYIVFYKLTDDVKHIDIKHKKINNIMTKKLLSHLLIDNTDIILY